MTTSESSARARKIFLPFVLRSVRLRPRTQASLEDDQSTSEDPMARTLASNHAGYCVARDTRVTRVGRETADDN